MISQSEMGKRIAELRIYNEYSQEELAEMLGIPRPSVAHIESGKRKVSAEELFQLSEILKFSMDKILAPGYTLKKHEEIQAEKTTSKKQEERIAVPKLKVDKFRQLLLYILEKCAGKPNVGETVLYKLLYFSEFNYYEIYEEHLVGATFKKLPFGPVPQKLDSILNDMQKKGQLKMIKTEYHGFLQKRYIPLQKPDLTQLKASEKVVVDNVLATLSDFSGKVISDYSHKDLPWKATKDGDTIDYELAFYREAPFSARNYENGEEE